MLWQNDINVKDKAFAQALYNLGVIYEKGLDVEADPNKARQFYLDAAKHDFPSALFKLGALDAANKNFESAASYWKKAVEFQVPEAAYNLAKLYQSGAGLAKDETQAAFWFKQTAIYALKKQKPLVYPDQSDLIDTPAVVLAAQQHVN